MHKKAYQITSLFSDRDHSCTTSAKEQDGSEKWQFLLVFSSTYADVRWEGGSGNIQKSAELL